MNLLNNYSRVLTIVLIEGRAFEDMAKLGNEGWSKRVKSSIYNIFIDVVGNLYMAWMEKDDALVHIDIDHEKKCLRAILFMDKRLYNKLFGRFIEEQQLRELARLVKELQDRIWAIDWMEFILEIKELQ
jgi:hypothetical protein